MPDPEQFVFLHHRLDDLIEMNLAAMFRADSRTMRMGDRLAYEFATALVIPLLLGVVLSWTLALEHFKTTDGIIRPFAQLQFARAFAETRPTTDRRTSGRKLRIQPDGGTNSSSSKSSTWTG